MISKPHFNAKGWIVSRLRSFYKGVGGCRLGFNSRDPLIPITFAGPQTRIAPAAERTLIMATRLVPQLRTHSTMLGRLCLLAPNATRAQRSITVFGVNKSGLDRPSRLENKHHDQADAGRRSLS